MNDDSKPFWKTSEFGMAAGAILLSMSVMAFGTYFDDAELVTSGREVMKFVMGGYIISRGLAKKG